MIFKFLKNKEKNANLSLNINERTREKSLGRSMVEMLGVLAIIGVLSIGGIQGYTIAMRKYRANEIANVAIKYAHLSYMSFQNYLKDNGDISVGQAYDGTICYFGGDNCVPNFSSRYGLLSFEQSGLGKYPSGVTYIGIYSILPGNVVNAVNGGSDMADVLDNYFEEKGLAKGDYVQLAIGFKDKQLCKTAASLFSGYISGGSYQDDADDCDGEYWAYVVKLIPMNN